MKYATLAFISLTALAITSGCKSSPINEDIPEPVLRAPALTAAHNAFLETDYVTMGKRIRDVMSDARVDQMAKDNARELLERGYEATGGKLPADWALPAGFEPMAYRQVRTETPDGPRLRVRLDGRVDDVKRIKSMKLFRGAELLLDMQGTGSKWFAGAPDTDGMIYYSLDSRDLPAFPEPGILTLQLVMTNGSVTEGWFINDKLASSASAFITEPHDSDTLKTGHPTVKWLPFRSPEAANYERRGLIMWLSRREDDGTYSNPWKSFGTSPDRTEARLGAGGEGSPDVDLPNGDYILDLVYDESRRFGPMSLVRRSTRFLTFHITR